MDSERVPCRFPAFVCFLILIFSISSPQAFAQSHPPSSPNKPIKEMLNADGSLNLSGGFSGSLDPAGYRMITGPNGEPRFVHTVGSRLSAPTTTSDPDDEFWDPRFPMVPTGMDGDIYSLVIVDSVVFAGGTFTEADQSPADHVAKWDRTEWSALGSGVNDIVRAIVVSGPNVYVGGDFTTAGGGAANRIAMWDGSGWSPLGTGMNGSVRSLAVIGGDLYAGGSFTLAGDVPANHVAKWDGLNWSGLGTGMNNAVFATTAIGDTLYAGGVFTTAGGTAANRVAKWNGASWSAVGTGMTGAGDTVFALKMFAGRLYVGGCFTWVGTILAKGIAQWNGASWSDVDTGVIGGGGTVRSLSVSGNYLIVGGDFAGVGGSVYSPFMAKWNGAEWDTAIAYADPFVTGRVLAVAANDSDIYIGGIFTSSEGANRVAKWNGSGWIAFGTANGFGMDCRVIAVCGSEVYAGGGESGYGGLMKWDGSIWTRIEGMTGEVHALAVSGSLLFVGGSFSTAGGTTVNHVAKWDGSNWLALGSGVNNRVLALAVSGKNLYAGGDFTSASGTQANFIAQWDGTNWEALGTGVNAFVGALAVSGTDLYAAGNFTTAGGSTANHIAKWDGSGWSALGSGLEYSGQFLVFTLAVSGTVVYAGGGLWDEVYGERGFLKKWDGSEWSQLLFPFGWIWALALSGDDLYVAGGFGGLANQIARWDGTSWFNLGSGIDWPNVHALAVSGADVYAGGIFYTAGGKQSYHFARWFKPLSGAAITKTFDTPTSVVDFSEGDNVTAVSVAVTSPSGGTTVLVNRYENAPKDSSSVVGNVSQYRWIIQQSGLAPSFIASVGFKVSEIPNNGISDPHLITVYWRPTPGRGSFVPMLTNYDSTSGRIIADGITSFGEFAFGFSKNVPADLYWGYSFCDPDLFNGAINAIAVSNDGVYVGGSFAGASGNPNADYVVRWDGTTWNALGSGLNDTVFAIAVSGSDVYVGGDFTDAGGNANADRIARWDGVQWNAVGTGLNSTVRTIAVCGSDVYAGGNFQNAGGNSSADRIARWDGASWNALGSGFLNTVHAIAISYDDSGGIELYAGGLFLNGGGQPNSDYIALWDGSSWSAGWRGLQNAVYAIAVNGRDVYVGGNFFQAGGVTGATIIARWDGSRWNALGSGLNDYVYSIAVSGTDVYAGGRFVTAGGVGPRYRIAHWDGSTWNALGGGMDTTVRAMAVSGNDVYVGGDFTRAGWRSSTRFGAWSKPTSAAAVTKSFSTPTASVSFHDATNVTAARMTVNSSSGGATVLAKRYEDAAQNVSGITGNVSQYRWTIQQMGFAPSCTATVGFRVSQIPNHGISDPTSVTIYWRPTPGRGAFMALTSTYDTTFDRINASGVSEFGEFALGSSSNPLPVQIVGVSAVSVKNAVEIRWSTATEVNNHGFEVERRTVQGSGFKVQGPQPETWNLKPETNWSLAGFVKGSGTSTSRNEYSFVDRSLPPGRYAYRLKQINNDGTFTYTSALEIEIGIPQTFSLSQNFPNPFNPTTTIEYELPQEVKVNLIVYDNLGRQVKTLVDDVQPAGWYKVAFDAQGFSSGMYYCRIQAGDFVKVKKLVLVR